MTSNADAARCKATTSKGNPCRNRALPGMELCSVHAGGGRTHGGAQSGPGRDEIAVLLEQILAVLLELRAGMAAQGQIREPDELTRELAAKVLAFCNQKMEVLKRRVDGDYTVDKWGRDLELMAEFHPLASFLFHKYWRVEATGLENIPASGRALLVANHSGVVPWDAVMIMTAVAEREKDPRNVRGLFHSWAASMPVAGLVLQRLGHVHAHPDNAMRLLSEDEAVLVFPEGAKGVGKPFSERYQLARFGRGGFVRSALRTGAPIIPVSVVGAEEIHPVMANAAPLAQLLNLPFLPITPTFPLLGPLGLIPLPSKWSIHFHPAIDLSHVKHGPSGEPLLVSKLTSEVREVIQQGIYDRLKKRKAVFW
ncbi:MAG: lysophospholipid acyltransferase family protein [Thermodesulfobacteriota bacterium]